MSYKKVASPFKSNGVKDVRIEELDEQALSAETAIGVLRSDLPIFSDTANYAELKQYIKQKGLLDKQVAYYIYKFLLTFGMLVLSLIFLIALSSFWIRLLSGICLAFVFTQIGLLGHDAGHRQICFPTWKNDLIGLVCGNLLIGMSYGWWTNKHNRHHSHPNQLDLDPDINIPLLCFTEEAAKSKRGILRFIAKRQAYFFFPLMLLVSLVFRLRSIHFLLFQKGKHPILELLLLGGHFSLYFGLVFSLLSFWQAILFITVHQSLFGLYMGSIFASNHKGMPILEKESQMDFLHRQVLTTRNIKGHSITDFVFGGLNYQIEHHLFPSMPRNNLKVAQQIIRDYCQKYSIAYCETTALQSYKEMLQYFHEIGTSLDRS